MTQKLLLEEITAVIATLEEITEAIAIPSQRITPQNSPVADGVGVDLVKLIVNQKPATTALLNLYKRPEDVLAAAERQ